MRLRWLVVVPLTLGVRALRVRRSVAPRRAYWRNQLHGDGPLLVALGDSLTQGTGSSRPSASWLGLLRTNLRTTAALQLRVDNRAEYGAKIADVLAEQLPLPANTHLVTVCIGANDAGRTRPDQFRIRLTELCAQLPPGSIVGDVPAFQWGPRIAAASQLSAIVREVVAAHPALVLAEVEKHTLGAGLRDLAGDLFHPGDPGHRRIAAAFIDAASQPNRIR